jgi:rieske iron-sulfur protein
MTAACEWRQTAPSWDIDRRGLLRVAIGASLALCTSCPAAAQTADPRTQRPQPNDRFVLAGGELSGQAVILDDVRAGRPPIMVFPVDPTSGVVRDGSRLNQILLVRLAPEDLDAESRARSADGIVAYSGVCTHAGCDVTLWRDETRRFRCPCHESEFDPRDRGRVVGGPAPRRLPQLPVKLVEGVIVASGGFTSRPGFQPG